MASHTYVTYTCDRCKRGLGDKKPERPQVTLVNASFNWREGPGPTFSWTDLCEDCDVIVKAFFDVEFAHASSNLREAREWMTELLAAPNRDQAGSIIYKARVLMGGKRTL